MPLYYYLGAAMLIGSVFLLLRVVMAAKSGSPAALYDEALKNENNGRLEDALVLYESANDEAKKIRTSAFFKNKIAVKLRLMQTVIEYNRNFITKK